jgi:hypothetical protein
MNGHDYPEYFEPTDDERRRDEDDTPQDGRSDELCPFCDHPLEWYQGTLICDNCDLIWHDADELEADRAR